MPDGLIRLHNSGQAHFVTCSCYRRQPLLAQTHMQNVFLVALEEARQRYQMTVYGFVVMPEHVHLLLSEPASGALARVMQTLKMRVSIAARERGYRRSGGTPFWQTRYFDHNVRNHDGFVTQLRYIHRNPVKRGLCGSPEEWAWSSFRAWATGESAVVQVESELIANRRELERMRAVKNSAFPPFSR